MKIGVLTGSRADYGIYKPLLKAFTDDDYFELKIIVFGTHLSHFHGYTKQLIEKDGFTVDYQIETLLTGDSPNAIASGVGLATLKFAEFWKDFAGYFDLVFCLGDRFEMFAAVSAGIPFNIKFAHIHGGETTLGAIDNIYRHTITLASTFHFCATTVNRNRIIELIHSDKNIVVTGAPSLDNLYNLHLFTVESFKKEFDIDLSIPTILCTFHPETVGIGQNSEYAEKMAETLLELTDKYQIVITLPNADTESMAIRERFMLLPDQSSNRIVCVENFGTTGYFSCMKHCSFLLGNTSSGIIEAASFKKFVINIGARQKGRQKGNNVIDAKIDKAEILNKIEYIASLDPESITNPYYSGGASDKIVNFLKALS